jgi:hypothetical protein
VWTAASRQEIWRTAEARLFQWPAQEVMISAAWRQAVAQTAEVSTVRFLRCSNHSFDGRIEVLPSIGI